jgi:hypothetical protein
MGIRILLHSLIDFISTIALIDRILSVEAECFSIPNGMVHHQLGMYSQDDICSILKIDNAYLFAKFYLRKIVWLPRPSFGLLLNRSEHYPQILAG